MTYANQLTILRMVFVPVFVLLLVYQHVPLALLVFFLAGLTDLLDGLIARRFAQRTHLGTLLDPIADKLLLVSSFVTLSLDSLDLVVRIPLWLTITVISRDLLLVLGVLVFNLTVGPRLFLPTFLGKLTTSLQLFLILLVLVSNSFTGPLPGLMWVCYAVLALTVSSGLHYMARGMKLLSQESPE